MPYFPIIHQKNETSPPPSGALPVVLMQVGDTVTCMVDYERRSRVAPNHTMTHVLNYALRAVLLGGQNDSSGMCEQKGSSVDADRLRFDFSWSKPLTPEQVEKVCQPPSMHNPRGTLRCM